MSEASPTLGGGFRSPLEPAELRLLDGLRLNPRRSFPGRVRGERLTARKGVSIEFADYRQYSEGDDLRHLDWNVLARLETPVMKTYRDEEDLAVHILVDTSPSMDFGEPTKLVTAAKLACALGYVSLNAGDAVYRRALGRREPTVSALRGRAGFGRLAAWTDSLTVNGGSALSTEVRGFVNSSAAVGVAVLISDCLDPEAPAAVRSLGGRGHEVLLIQILSPEEIDPDLEGDLRLLDSETGAPIEVTANGFALAEYKRRLTAHNQGLADAVLRVGGRYALVQPGQPLKEIVQNTWKREGWVA